MLRIDGDMTFHHNVFAHHRSRNPRPGTYGKDPGLLLDFRNNLIYDWGSLGTPDSALTMSTVSGMMVLLRSPASSTRVWR